MAKKKVTAHTPKQENHPQHQPPTITHHRTSMENPEEKLHNLKSLNAVLLKETIERRQQVESLLQAKEMLEIHLGKTGTEKTELENELTGESELRVSLEIEKGLFCVFIETQIEEMGVLVEGLEREKREKENVIVCLKSEIDGLKVNLKGERENFIGVFQQRDLLMMEVDDFRKETDSLKDKVIDMEKKEIMAAEEIRKLNGMCTNLSLQIQETEGEIEEVKKLRNLAEKEVALKVNEIEDLYRNVEQIVRKKDEIERENGERKIQIRGLQKEVSEFSETVLSLRKEEGILREKLLELEKRYDEEMNKGNVIAMEIDALVEEKKATEKTIEKLMEEADSNEKLIKNLNNEVKDKDGWIENLLREKKEIEDVKVGKESEIVKLHNEVATLRDVIFELQESTKNQEEQNKLLASEVSHCRGALEEMKLERDGSQRDLDREKRNTIGLMSRVLEMEKTIEETTEELAKKKSHCENLLEKKTEFESQIVSLRKEKDSVQNNLLEAKQEMDNLRTKMESVGSNLVRAVTMVKKTAALLCQSENGNEVISSTEKKVDEIEPELEAIKNAFRSKEIVMEEMKQQLKCLQNSVSEANKQKGLWALVSSATTFVLAASVAYFARLR